MNLNHRLMIAIVKRGASRDVIAAAKEAGADGATVLYAEGIGRNEKPTFLGLPATHEKDVVFIAVDGEIEFAVAEAISHAGKLGKSGYGLGFTVHLSKLLGVPHLTEREDDRKKKRGVEKMPEPKDFQLIVTIVNSGDSGQVVKAAARAGAEGGTILEGRGTGVNEQKKFMNFTIDPEKDVVLTLVPSAFAEKVVASIEQAVDLDAPGKGIAFLIDVENVFGVNHSSLNP
ncbi:PII family protein [Planococcus rifietoensis]|uniref:PII family protein n=1 Tax=Planococcus rifietoensis TaxID=200991 RepID=A0A0U2ZFH5_9BACL|nr:P-II family nitrogen regulator [Planococcus rifietoensis]ALS75989.1 PII family protein [Planococcus rifietoensis]